MKRFFGTACVLLLLGATTGFACSLPAEPMGAAVPDTSAHGFSSVAKLVQDGSRFYYLVPEGTTAQLKVVWDPYDHNGGNLGDKYDWVAEKAGLPFEPNTDAPLGKGYFGVEAMSQFFGVSGNRGSITEAFQRQVGGLPGEQFMPDSAGLGPAALLTAAFVKPGNQGKVSIDSNKAPDWSATPQLCSPSGTDLAVEDLDAELPCDRAAFSPKTLSNESGTTRTSITYVTGASGIYMGDLAIGVTQIRAEDYKAYIVEGDSGAYITGLPLLPEGSGAGTPGPTFDVLFSTPTLGAAVPEIRVKVNAPSAGFEITNLFWCWIERVATENYVDGPDADTTPDHWEAVSSVDNKCSVGLKIVLNKPGGGNGYTGFRVFDKRGPLASKFELTTPPVLKCGDAMPEMDFTMDFLDTNPFALAAVGPLATKADGTLTQSADIIKDPNNLLVYFSYPVYDFKTKSGISFADLPQLTSSNLGLLKFEDPKSPTFSGGYYEPKWLWKKATLTNVNVTQVSTKNADGTTLKGGGVYRITGKMAFNQPVPWHFATEGGKSEPYSAHGKKFPTQELSPQVDKVMKIFAVMKDSTGRMSIAWDAVAATSDTDHLDSAGEVLERAVKPADSTELKTDHNGEPPLTAALTEIAGASTSPISWQNYSYLKVEDKSPPEIQVFVFDTRNNRYHLFGSAAGGDAKYTNFGAKAETTYASLSPVPYCGADSDALKGGCVFDRFDASLFDKFFDKAGNGGVSMLDSGNEKGAFICQRNTRLVFYVRAWDNINTYDKDKGQGVQTVSYDVVDRQSPDAPPSQGHTNYNIEELFRNPPVWQFRYSNSDGSSFDTSGKECSLTIKAKDYSNNEAELKIYFAIIDNDMQIRSLEEKRNRTY